MSSPGSGPGGGLAADRVADAVRERIIEGDLPSDAALREAGLATELRVSRNSVREGFRLLAREGLVVHEQHRGVRVRRLSEADVRDIYAVRRTVEPLGLPEVDTALLSSIVTAAAESATAGDWKAVSTADLRFHQSIAAAAGSPRFDAMFTGLLAELRLAFTMLPPGQGFHEPYLRRNGVIVDLLADGDLGGAQAELTAYLSDAEEEIVRRLFNNP